MTINFTDPAVISVITAIGTSLLSLLVSKIPSANIVLQILRAILVAPRPEVVAKTEEQK